MRLLLLLLLRLRLRQGQVRVATVHVAAERHADRRLLKGLRSGDSTIYHGDADSIFVQDLEMQCSALALAGFASRRTAASAAEPAGERSRNRFARARAKSLSSPPLRKVPLK